VQATMEQISLDLYNGQQVQNNENRAYQQVKWVTVSCRICSLYSSLFFVSHKQTQTYCCCFIATVLNSSTDMENSSLCYDGL